MSSATERLQTAAGRPPHPTPGTPRPQGRSLQDLGAGVGPGGALPERPRRRGDGYGTDWLTDQQRAELAQLVSALREAAPDTTGQAIRKPTAWARTTGMHRRFAYLLALDWRYLRRPQLANLERLVVALGLGADAAHILATSFPNAIAPDRTGDHST